MDVGRRRRLSSCSRGKGHGVWSIQSRPPASAFSTPPATIRSKPDTPKACTSCIVRVRVWQGCAAVPQQPMSEPRIPVHVERIACRDWCSTPAGCGPQALITGACALGLQEIAYRLSIGVAHESTAGARLDDLVARADAIAALEVELRTGADRLNRATGSPGIGIEAGSSVVARGGSAIRVLGRACAGTASPETSTAQALPVLPAGRAGGQPRIFPCIDASVRASIHSGVARVQTRIRSAIETGIAAVVAVPS